MHAMCVHNILWEDKNLNCAKELCIYNDNQMCILDDIDINTLGMCDDCIVVKLDKDFLKAEKEKHLLEIDSRANQQLKVQQAIDSLPEYHKSIDFFAIFVYNDANDASQR